MDHSSRMEVSYVIGRLIGGVVSNKLGGSHAIEADILKLSKSCSPLLPSNLIAGFTSAVDGYPRYLLWRKKDLFLKLCGEMESYLSGIIWREIFSQPITDTEFNGTEPDAKGSPEQLAVELEGSLFNVGFCDGAWDEGYTEDDVVKALREINEFLAEKGFQGSVIVVWDYFDREPGFAGNSDIFYHVAALPHVEMARSVPMPLFRGNLERFITEILAIDADERELEKFEPVYVGSFDYNACWELRC